MGKQPARRRNQSRCVTEGGLGWNDPTGENAVKRRRVVDTGVRMHVNVVQILRGACEEELPKRCKREWGCGQEHESKFLYGFRARVDPGSKFKQ